MNTNSHITQNATPSAKIALFRSLFRRREDLYPRDSKVEKRGKQAIHLLAETNGSVGYAKSLRLNAPNAGIAAFWLLLMMLSTGI